MDTLEFDSLHSFLSSDPNNRTWPSHAVTKNEKNNYRRKTKRFTFSNGTLRYNHKTHGCVRVIKETEMDIILQGCHSDPLAGHQGINRTTFKVKERYYWPGLEADIRDYIRHCDKCQRQNCLAKASAELHPIPVKDRPFDMLGLDLVGPLHTTDNNNRFIAVLTDYFTKWPEVKAIPSKHSHHIAEFIIEVICRHGTPSEVITDRGREFCNKVNSILCSKLNIDHKVSSPYHPQTNGLTERFNQTLCNSLRKYVNDQQNDWDQYLQQVAFAARTCVQKSTKQTPFFLVYGRKPTLPIELDIPTAMPSDNSDEVELNHRIVSFVHLIKTQKDTKEEIKKAQTKQKEYHDRNHQKPFLPGEQVLVKNSKRINRCGDKMVHRWTGPFTIADYIGKGVYKVNGRKTVLNAKSLRRYLTPKTTAKSQKPTAKSQKPSTKRQKPTAMSQKPSAKSQTAKIPKPLKQLKTLSSNVKLQQARKTSNQPTNISKETALNDFERWLTLLPNSSLEFIVDKCSNYNMTNPRDILHFTAASLECPRLSMYLKWQKNTPSDHDQCITTLVERLKPHPLRKLPNPVKRVPAIMITAAVLLEAYSTTSKPEDVLLTLEDVPLGYSVESKFCFSKTKTKQRLHVAGHALTTADLRSLRPREWLNDQIVNAFLCLSSTESNKQAPHHSYVLPSHLALKWEGGDYGSWIFKMDSLMQYKLILMPVCYKDHWFLLVARPSHRTVGVLDSMHSISRQTRFLNHWRKFMKARHQIVTGTPTSWTLEQFVSSKQADGDSCGVFVLMNAYAILHKKEPTIMRQCHVKGYRKFVSHQLFTHSTTTP